MNLTAPPSDAAQIDPTASQNLRAARGCRIQQSKAPLLIRLRDMDEVELTGAVVRPLFHAIGFHKVDYHGPPCASGKSLICWRTDEIGQPEVVVVQVKRFHPSPSPSSQASFVEVVNQLQQAAESLIPNLDGLVYRPSLIYFVTPFPVDTRSLQGRFEAYATLRGNRVKLIDGTLLTELLHQNLPQRYQAMTGGEKLVRKAITKQLNNVNLRLDSQLTVDLAALHGELDFGAGAPASPMLFPLRLEPKIQPLAFSPVAWAAFRSTAEQIGSYFTSKLVSPSFTEIEAQTKLESDNVQRILAEEVLLDEVIYHTLEPLRTLNGPLRMWIKRLTMVARPNNPPAKRARRLSPADKQLSFLSNLAHRMDQFLAGITHRTATEADVAALDREFARWAGRSRNDSSYKPGGRRFRPDFDKMRSMFVRTQSLLGERGRLKLEFDQPKYRCQLNGKYLADELKQKQHWLSRSVRQFHRSAPPVDKLRDFLNECSRLFEAAGRVLHHQVIADCVGFATSQPSGEADEKILANLSVHDVLETGLNVLVLADARPGQTINWQMYAKRRLERKGNDELIFFLPLAKVLAGSAAASATLPPGDRLEKCIAEFLGSLDPEISKTDLAITLRAGHGAVLFDGLDEAVPANPWVVEAINQFNNRYPRLQCIVSSRRTGDYIKDFRLLTITLRAH